MVNGNGYKRMEWNGEVERVEEMEREEEGKSRILIVGGSGYIGRRFVRASLSLGHPTYVLFRPFSGLDLDKLHLLFSFRNAGAHLLKGSFDDKESLVAAVKQVDVVICATAGNHIPSHAILQQMKLVEAIKEAGNIKRYLPSEFGMDPDKMMDAMEPGNVTFIDKREVRRVVEAAEIPYTYVSANCFASYFVGGLAQLDHTFPPSHKVFLYGDGNVKAIWVDEEDVATYTIKSAVDPRTANKTVYIRPPANILSQREVIELWEKKSRNVLEKISLSRNEFLNLMKEKNLAEQIVMTHLYHIFYDGCLYNFQIGEEGREASHLYPEVKYTTVDAFLDRYLI